MERERDNLALATDARRVCNGGEPWPRWVLREMPLEGRWARTGLLGVGAFERCD